MRARLLPTSVHQYRDEFLAVVAPDSAVTQDAVARGIFDFTIDQRVPILYDPTAPGERWNFSNLHGALATRHYENLTVESLYYLHECAHMLPAQDSLILDKDAFVEAVVEGERLASAETEVAIHWRLPSLRRRAFGNMLLLVELFDAAGFGVLEATELVELRNHLIESDELDHLLVTATDRKDEAASVLESYRQYRRTPEWAARHYAVVSRYLGVEDSLDHGPSCHPTAYLSAGTYQQALGGWQPQLCQECYAHRAVANVRRVCRLAGRPELYPCTIEEANAALMSLDRTALLCPAFSTKAEAQIA